MGTDTLYKKSYNRALGKVSGMPVIPCRLIKRLAGEVYFGYTL
jgi:hypothetical protein